MGYPWISLLILIHNMETTQQPLQRPTVVLACNSFRRKTSIMVDTSLQSDSTGALWKRREAADNLFLGMHCKTEQVILQSECSWWGDNDVPQMSRFINPGTCLIYSLIYLRISDKPMHWLIEAILTYYILNLNYLKTRGSTM